MVFDWQIMSSSTCNVGICFNGNLLAVKRDIYQGIDTTSYSIYFTEVATGGAL